MNGGVAFIEKQIASMPGEIARLKDAAQKASDAAAKTRLESNLAQAEAYLAELRVMKPPIPSGRCPRAWRSRRAAGRSV